jgi:methyltransferase
LVEQWAGIGLKKLFLGLESPSDDEIKALNKKGTVNENNRAIEILHEHGIDPLGAFIIRPDYTRGDFDRVIEYMDRMRIYYFEFTILTPFPGTEFHNDVAGELVANDTRLFDLAHSIFPTRLPTDRFYREFSRLHRRTASPLRALRIRPVVSPFRRFAFVRMAPRMANLFWSSRRAYRLLRRMEGNGVRH